MATNWTPDPGIDIGAACEIRRRAAAGETQTALAAEFSTHQTNISLKERGLRLHLNRYVACRTIGHVWEVDLLSLPPMALFERPHTGVSYPRGECAIEVPNTEDGRQAYERARAAHFGREKVK